MTVRQLLNSIDSRELSEWVAFFNLENQKGKRKETQSLSEKIKAFFSMKKKRKR